LSILVKHCPEQSEYLMTPALPHLLVVHTLSNAFPGGQALIR
jgi:hypothetical protein